jgi:hypothetical protein
MFDQLIDSFNFQNGGFDLFQLVDTLHVFHSFYQFFIFSSLAEFKDKGQLYTLKKPLDKPPVELPAGFLGRTLLFSIFPPMS